MVKVWKEANFDSYDIPSDLETFKRVMEEIPRHQGDSNKVIYRKKEYIILQCRNDYVVHNKKKKFEDGHTHTNNFNLAKSIIDMCIREKLPNKPNKRLVTSLIRVSDSNRYKEKLRSL